MHHTDHAPGILIIDDEPAIRGLLQTTASRAGLRAWTARDGEEALAVFQRHRDDISLVLCDVRMPGMDGPAVISALRRDDPALRFCFISGGTGDYTAEHLLGLGALRLFEKPFTIHLLGHQLLELATAGQASAA
jgi:CheY-like chemotaxis protein